MGSGEEKRWSKAELVKATRVLPEGTSSARPEENDNYIEFQVPDKWRTDLQFLRWGPKIGEGASSKVFEGKYKDRSVAIKQMEYGDTPEENAKRERRFAREVTLLSRMQHKSLVMFVGASKESTMIVVTELLTGGSLRQHLRDLRPNCLEIHTALSYALDVAQAMECLHKNGIIHRDLKPDNLLLTADKKKVKLADFGLAREEVTEMMTSETGTVRWMAPEMYSTVTLKRGEKTHYDHRVDVYSFAMVLWELLTNKKPFEGKTNIQAVYAAFMRKERPAVDDLPEDLVFILQCCWAEDPNLRPDFSQIVRMLNQFISTLPAPERFSSTPSAPERTPPPMQAVTSTNNVPIMHSPGTVSLAESQPDADMKLKNSAGKLMVCFGSCFRR